MVYCNSHLELYTATNCLQHISPIIFVAHSLGTLILQAALVEESKRSNSTILAFTKSIVFLGGPRFDNDQDWERFGAALTRILKGSLSLSQLQFDLFSEIRSKFDTLLNQPNVSKPDICCFYETLPVYRTGIVSNSRPIFDRTFAD